MKLFSVFLGGRADKCNIELHDVVFTLGEKIEDSYNDLLGKWFGLPDRLHIDSWVEINMVEGYKVSLSKEKNKTNKKKDILTLILGGPTKYYNYSTQNIKSIFSNIKNLTEKNNLHLIVIPSNRTPMETVSLAKSELINDTTIIETVDKKAYLSALCLAKYIVVTCDSSSMISEAALTGKPVYVAMIETKRNDKRFKEFRKLFENMNILRKLDDKLETWSYEKLDEANRVSKLIKLK